MAKVAKPIKTDLFRFTTLRTPQLIDHSRKELGFIFHPNSNESFFLKDFTQNVEIDRSSLDLLSGKFSSMNNYQSIRQINIPLYEFGLWLSRNKNKLQYNELSNKLKPLIILELDQEIVVWDNLLYQVYRKTNPVLRQACSNLIIANNFIKKIQASSLKENALHTFNEERDTLSAERKIEKYIHRTANAKIVIPEAFSFDKSDFSIEYMNQNNRKELESHLKISKQKLKNKNLTQLKTEFEALSELNSKGTINSILKSKNVKVSTTLKNHFLNEKNKDASIKSNLSKLTNKIKKEELKINNQKIGLNRNKKNKKIKVSNYSLMFHASPNSENEYELFLTIKLPSNTVSISNIDFKLHNSKTLPISFNKVEEVNEMEGFKTYKIITDKLIKLPNTNQLKLNGSISLNNNKTIPLKLSKNRKGKKDEINMFAEPEKARSSTSSTTPLYGVNRLGVGIYRRVEQEVCCYVPGEVSRIENIMAKEYKERHTRSLTSTENTEESLEETQFETQNDTTSTTRNELQKEVSKELSKSSDFGVGASLGYSGGGFSADAYFDYASSNSSSNSDSEAKTYAEEITKSALEKVIQKTNYKRTSKIIQEFEENNRHGYDNRNGDKHVTGVYRWIDIIYTNRLINYGKRLMVEFLIPEPARFFKQALKNKKTSITSTNALPEMPVHPSEHGLNSPSDLEGYENINYEELGSIYGVSISAPPDENKTVSDRYLGVDLKVTKEFSNSGVIVVPPDYHCNNATINGSFNHDALKIQGTNWVIGVGSGEWSRNIQEGGNNDRIYVIPESIWTNFPLFPQIIKENANVITFDDYLTETIKVTISGDRTLSYDISITLNCEILPEVYNAWQVENYNKIMDAYETKLKEYEAKIAEQEQNITTSENELTSSSNTSFNRTIEQREIQRLAIEMITRPFNIEMGNEDLYSEGSCGVCETTCPPYINQTESWEEYASHVKFFEQAFDWKAMSYLFYPYYWAERCDWAELIQIENSADPIFEAFLQSGMCRVVVPARQGFGRAVSYYLETGDIWNGGDLVMDRADDLYLSIDEELSSEEGFVDQEWETRVPTTLTIIQGDSVFLEDEGLPCCDKLNETDTLLRGSANVLGTITAPTS